MLFSQRSLRRESVEKAWRKYPKKSESLDWTSRLSRRIKRFLNWLLFWEV